MIAPFTKGRSSSELTCIMDEGGVSRGLIDYQARVHRAMRD